MGDSGKPELADREFTVKDVAAHKDANDLWIIVHGEGKKSHCRE